VREEAAITIISPLLKEFSNPTEPPGLFAMRRLRSPRFRKDHRGVDLIFDALPFGRLWCGQGSNEP
jgi:hypothetical protein